VRILSALLAQGGTCKWLTEADSVFLRGETDGVIDGVRALLGDAAADSLTRTPQSPLPTDPCGGAADLQKKSQVIAGRLQWLARLDMLADFIEAQPWGKGLTSITDNHRWIRLANAELRLKVINTPAATTAWVAFVTATRPEMSAMAGVMCQVSQALSGGRPGCPAEERGSEKLVPGVMHRSSSFEQFAAAVRREAASDPARYWKRLPAGEAVTNTPPTCAAGDLVANFFAGDAETRMAPSGREGVATTRLIAFGSGDDLGSVTASGLPQSSPALSDPLLRTYNPFTVIDADESARGKGVVPGVAFVRCKVP
jgi:hypothetical protein